MVDLTSDIATLDDPNLPSSIYGRTLFGGVADRALALARLRMFYAAKPDLDGPYLGPHIRADGSIEGGVQYQAGDLSPLYPEISWEEGLQAIENFDWEQVEVTEAAKCRPEAETPQRKSAGVTGKHGIGLVSRVKPSLLPVSIAAENSEEKDQMVRDTAYSGDEELTIPQLQSKERIASSILAFSNDRLRASTSARLEPKAAAPGANHFDTRAALVSFDGKSNSVYASEMPSFRQTAMQDSLVKPTEAKENSVTKRSQDKLCQAMEKMEVVREKYARPTVSTTEDVPIEELGRNAINLQKEKERGGLATPNPPCQSDDCEDSDCPSPDLVNTSAEANTMSTETQPFPGNLDKVAGWITSPEKSSGKHRKRGKSGSDVSEAEEVTVKKARTQLAKEPLAVSESEDDCERKYDNASDVQAITPQSSPETVTTPRIRPRVSARELDGLAKSKPLTRRSTGKKLAERSSVVAKRRITRNSNSGHKNTSSSEEDTEGDEMAEVRAQTAVSTDKKTTNWTRMSTRSRPDGSRVQKAEGRAATVNEYGFQVNAQTTLGQTSGATVTGNMAGKAKTKRSTTTGKQKVQHGAFDESIDEGSDGDSHGGSDGEREVTKGKGDGRQQLAMRRTRGMEAKEREAEKKKKEEEGLRKVGRGRRSTRRRS